MKLLTFVLMIASIGCGSEIQASSPQSSIDQLIDPQGSWSKDFKNPHLNAMPKQFAKWKAVDSSVHTWCIGFTAKECEENYSEGNWNNNTFWLQVLQNKVDPQCAAAPANWGDNTCEGNLIHYSETEYSEPSWKPGRVAYKYYTYTAEGHWECPNGFTDGTEFGWGGTISSSSSGYTPSVYYVPPKPSCSRTFYWGIWRLSPYRSQPRK